jgi:hypothetical protein
VRFHGGKVIAMNRQPSGLTIEIRLPMIVGGTRPEKRPETISAVQA